MNVRALALDVLVKSERSTQYSNIAIDNAITKNGLDSKDGALLSVLVYGVIERKITLDYIIDSLSSIAPSKIELSTRNVLRMGLYQLIYLDRIPPHAAINESVELAGKRSRGFVNAILRGYTRKKDEIEFPKKESDLIKYLSVTYSVPSALCEKFLENFGAEKTEDVLRAFSAPTKTTLRVNTLKISRDELLSRLISKGVDVEKTPVSPCGINVFGASVNELFLDEGLCFVQDEASQICVSALDAKKGDLVMDICACPGSKSFGAAIEMENEGKILAFDLHENKLSLVKSGATRLGIEIIDTCAHDGREFMKEYEAKADKIICDVPCSGFGVIAKKPEIRYKDPKESAGLPKIQYDILKTASKYLKVGGTLVYSTCTLLKEENEDNVNKFLAEHGNFKLQSFSLGDKSVDGGMLTLDPHEHGTDGFFIAKLIKTNE